MLSALASYTSGVENSTATIIELGLYVLMFVGFWKLFEKGGQEGWKAIIPYYNIYKMLEFTRGYGSIGLLILYLIPGLNLITMFILASSTSRAFGKDGLYTALLFLFPWIGYPLLGFSDAEYYGPMGVDDYRTPEARGASTVSFEVQKNEPEEEDTIHFDVE